jgi:hypothetical protein
MNYVPVVNFSKGIPYGIKKFIRKQMHMEIDYFFGNLYHKQRHLVHLLTSPVIPVADALQGTKAGIQFLSSLVGFFPVNPFVCRAVWAYAMLDSLDKPISEPSLLLSCARAYRTFDTTLGHFFIFFGWGSCCHVYPPELNWALWGCLKTLPAYAGQASAECIRRMPDALLHFSFPARLASEHF